jgi:hypothetical protein
MDGVVLVGNSLGVAVAVSGRCQVGISRAGDSVPMNSSAIAASGLRKAYGDKTILDGIEPRTDALICVVRSRQVTSERG